MKKILIALDHSPTGQKVAEAGYALAKGMHLPVVLLHVVSDPVYYASTEYSPIMGYTGTLGMEQFQPVSVEELKKASHQFLEKTKQHLGDENIETLVGEGDFAEAILKAAKSTHAVLIVMGSHSHKWLENIIMGSVTEKVLHQTSIPLFIIPTRRKK
jgi:nucleotide-binding universal stress UspA family protein